MKMNTIRQTLSVTWKEFLVIIRDRTWLMILFLMPLLIATLVGGMNVMAWGGDKSKPAILLEVALVNLDEGIFGQEISKNLSTIKELKINTYTTVAEADEQVASGKLKAAIIIPADFSRKVSEYTPGAVQVIVDPAAPESTSIVTGIMNQVVSEVTIWGEVQHGVNSLLKESGLFDKASPQEMGAIAAESLGAIMTRLNELRKNPTISLVSEDLQGAKVEGGIALFMGYLYPAMTVMFIFFITPLAATSLMEEREMGTLRRLLSSPLPRTALIAGKILAYMLLACLQVLVLFTVAHFLFGMSLGPAPLGLVVITLLTAFTATSLGMLVAAISRTTKQAANLGIMLALVLAGVGGALPVSYPPVFRAEGVMGMLAKLTPQMHAVNAFYSLISEGAVFSQVLSSLGILLAMGLVFFFIAVRHFRFDA
jgi:ABC-2 type transport system permease protein